MIFLMALSYDDIPAEAVNVILEHADKSRNDSDGLALEIAEKLAVAFQWAIESCIDDIVNKRGGTEENYAVPRPVKPF